MNGSQLSKRIHDLAMEGEEFDRWEPYDHGFIAGVEKCCQELAAIEPLIRASEREKVMSAFEAFKLTVRDEVFEELIAEAENTGCWTNNGDHPLPIRLGNWLRARKDHANG